MQRQLHLNLFFHSRGHHEASWRHPGSSPLPLTDIRYYQELARKAEAAKFDSIFLADQLALGEDAAQAARTWLEPVTVLAALAVSTSRIGLIATCSTTYTEPFNLARQFASIVPSSATPSTTTRWPGSRMPCPCSEFTRIAGQPSRREK